MQGRVGPAAAAALLRCAQAASEKENVCVNSIRGRLHHRARSYSRCWRAASSSAGGNLLDERVRHHALGPVLHRGRVLHALRPTPRSAPSRETLQVMAYEPMVLFMAVGVLHGRRHVRRLRASSRSTRPSITSIWLVFLGFLFVLTIKLRKSPFDLSVLAPRPPGARQGHHHRDERPDARQGGDHALVRERAVPGMGRHVLRLGQPAFDRARPRGGRRSCTSWRSGSTTTSPA